MKEFKISTVRGKQVYQMGVCCLSSTLEEIYGRYSKEKANAFRWCREQFYKDENAHSFGVGNANTFGFTCSWLTTINGSQAMRVETKDNSYIVWLDR